MASKQIGKLRQRVGEIVGLGSKTNATDAFKELEAEVQMRGAGMERLRIQTDAYIKNLQTTDTLESGADPANERRNSKYVPCEALGTVMMDVGDQYLDYESESVYGQSLRNLGRVHVKIATLQEEYTEALQFDYMNKLQDGLEAIKEYQAARKKLESRRLALDSQAAKLARAKKEKEKIDAQDELDTAQHRYDEMQEEVEDRMLSIKKREGDQFSELTEFLDIEIAYAAAYHNQLMALKNEWPHADAANIPSLTHRRSTYASRPTTPNPVLESPSPTRPTFRNPLTPGRDRAARASEDVSYEFPSRGGRKRASTTSTPVAATPKQKEKEPKKSSDAILAGSKQQVSEAAGGVKGWFSRSLSKKNFQTLDDDEEANQSGAAHSRKKSFGRPRNSSFSNGPALNLHPSQDSARTTSSSMLSSEAEDYNDANHPPSPSAFLRMHKPSHRPAVRRASVAFRPPGLLRVRALYSLLNVAPDELAFHAGDLMTVLDEQWIPRDSDDLWVRADRDGLVGLIPMNYCEVVEESEAEEYERSGSGLSNYETGPGIAGYNPAFAGVRRRSTKKSMASTIASTVASGSVSTRSSSRRGEGESSATSLESTEQEFDDEEYDGDSPKHSLVRREGPTDATPHASAFKEHGRKSSRSRIAPGSRRDDDDSAYLPPSRPSLTARPPTTGEPGAGARNSRYEYEYDSDEDVGRMFGESSAGPVNGGARRSVGDLTSSRAEAAAPVTHASSRVRSESASVPNLAHTPFTAAAAAKAPAPPPVRSRSISAAPRPPPPPIPTTEKKARPPPPPPARRTTTAPAVPAPMTVGSGGVFALLAEQKARKAAGLPPVWAKIGEDEASPFSDV
ncbi:BAR-domain-containing protein [Clavulina sp. PMI_390]|nr:BAR-domain-containing protein [Clavulina sp. PMI_390]